jgi:hypothetical protein
VIARAQDVDAPAAAPYGGGADPRKFLSFGLRGARANDIDWTLNVEGHSIEFLRAAWQCAKRGLGGGQAGRVVL